VVEVRRSSDRLRQLQLSVDVDAALALPAAGRYMVRVDGLPAIGDRLRHGGMDVRLMPHAGPDAMCARWPAGSRVRLQLLQSLGQRVLGPVPAPVARFPEPARHVVSMAVKR
jgi:hypothetical protein